MASVQSKDGSSIAYELSGKGPAVILVDGALGYRDHYGGRPLAAELSKSFRVIVYDRRGRGESTDTGPYRVEKEIEDLEALIDNTGVPVHLYGFSSGAVLAVKAAAVLGDKISRLAVLEPPCGDDTDEAKTAFTGFSDQLNQLIRQGKNSDAVSFFLSGMVPPEMLAGMQQTPDWKRMESVAPTLSYDIEVMGDGAVPVSIAGMVRRPSLVLVGSDSPEFKHTAAITLARALSAQLITLNGQTMMPPETLGPVLKKFFQG